MEICAELPSQTADGNTNVGTSVRSIVSSLQSIERMYLHLYFHQYLHKETQTAVVWSCFPFIRSGKNHLARHSERGKKTRQTEEEVGRQHKGMDRAGVRQVQEGSGEQGKMEKTGRKIICGASTTLTVKGLMMIMISILKWGTWS